MIFSNLRAMKAALFLGWPLLLFGTSARGGNSVDVKIINDGTEDILVTVYDMSTRPERIVFSNARLNGFTSAPIFLIAAADGKANLAWTATSTDTMFPKCGHAITAVANAGSVNVRADSQCGP
jgi:hypothetical protein